MRASRKSAHHNQARSDNFIVIFVTKAGHIGHRSNSQEDTPQPKANLDKALKNPCGKKQGPPLPACTTEFVVIFMVKHVQTGYMRSSQECTP